MYVQTLSKSGTLRQSALQRWNQSEIQRVPGVSYD